MQDLTGKRVLVTGGARRVGAAICHRFAAAGAVVIIHCRESRAEAEALAKSLPGAGHRVVVADFADPAAIEALIASLPEPPDCLVNNASCYAREETPAFRAACRQINVLAPVRLIRAFAARGCESAVNLLRARGMPGEKSTGRYLNRRSSSSSSAMAGTDAENTSRSTASRAKTFFIIYLRSLAGDRLIILSDYMRPAMPCQTAVAGDGKDGVIGI